MSKQPTFDVVLAPGGNKPAAATVVTVTDFGAAGRIVDAINKEQQHLFQCDGLKAFVRTVSRDVPEKKDEAPAQAAAPEATPEK